MILSRDIDAYSVREPRDICRPIKSGDGLFVLWCCRFVFVELACHSMSCSDS